MAELTILKPRVEVEAVITLNRQELAALDALVGYGVEKLIIHFYKQMGESYLRPHVEGLRSFLEAATGASAGLNAARDVERVLENHAIDKHREKLAKRAALKES